MFTILELEKIVAQEQNIEKEKQRLHADFIERHSAFIESLSTDVREQFLSLIEDAEKALMDMKAELYTASDDKLISMKYYIKGCLDTIAIVKDMLDPVSYKQAD